MLKVVISAGEFDCLFFFATLPPLPQQALKSITGRKMGEGGRSFQPHQVDRLTEVAAEGNWSLWKEANTERKRELLTKQVFHFQTHWTLCTASAHLEDAQTSEGKNACEMITAERSLIKWENLQPHCGATTPRDRRFTPTWLNAGSASLSARRP